MIPGTDKITADVPPVERAYFLAVRLHVWSVNLADGSPGGTPG